MSKSLTEFESLMDSEIENAVVFKAEGKKRPHGGRNMNKRHNNKSDICPQARV